MSLINHYQLNSRYQFPDPKLADPDGEGLIVFGGDLAADTLICAYSQGMFPWFNEGEPIAWWSPDPRCLIYPKEYLPSKTLKRKIKNAGWTFSINGCFNDVILACADSRAYANETWISPAMIEAYNELNRQQVAHSIEIWEDDSLIGGLYGLKLGSAFFGESMFHRTTDASKAAFFVLMRLCEISQFEWVDCQLPNPHLMSLGATTISRSNFLISLQPNMKQPSTDWSAVSNQRYTLSNLLEDNFIIKQSHQLIAQK